MVAFSHTIFAMPFAASAAMLSLPSIQQKPTPLTVVLMLVCMVCARTAAMAYNRYLDRDIDAANPRTKMREVPAGVVSPRAALLLTILSSVVFVGAASLIGFWPGVLSAPVLLVLLGYSWCKRFTWAAHLVLGLALALAPGGAWIAMGALPNVAIVSLMAAVLTWVAGFDVLYSLQDEAFDKQSGLHSIPSRFGVKRSVVISAALHVITVTALVSVGVLLQRGPLFYGAVLVIAALLTYEHKLVGWGDLSKINKAFFDINGYVSMVFFALTLGDTIWLKAW